MVQVSDFLSHSVTCEDRGDGTLLLRSNLELGEVVKNTGVWLHRWAAETPDRVFMAERDGDGWREVTYAETLDAVRQMASGLLQRDLGADRPILCLSGPSIDHGILTLAAQYIGVPTVPLAEQYSLIAEAESKLRYCAGKVQPGLVYAQDADTYATALGLDIFDGVEKVTSTGDGTTRFDDLATPPSADLDAAYDLVGPDTLAKILFTSGSTSDPKGVPQTQRMMCVNQSQYLACLPILGEMHHEMLDWLPWNHVFAGSSNFNMMLSNGGSWYLDDGKPGGPGAARTIENMGMRQSSLCFDVPVAHSMQVAAMKADAELARKYFEKMVIFFYAGASLPADVWASIEDMSVKYAGAKPMMMSSWGLTETAPAAMIYHQLGGGSGMVGVPAPQLEVKLISQGDNRYEVRLRGPNIFTGYYKDEKRSAEAFDDEGFFITGDAMQFVDPDDPNQGMRFDGRIGEDFKLTTGTWVQASTLRLKALGALGDLVQDVVIVGEGQGQVGMLVFPPAGLGLQGDGDVIADIEYSAKLTKVIADMAASASGSSNRIARALVMAEPPNVGAGEITAKGSLNVRAITQRRAAVLQRLYDNADPAVITV